MLEERRCDLSVKLKERKKRGKSRKGNSLLDDNAVIRMFGSLSLDETILRVGFLLGEGLVEKVISLDHI